MELFRRAFAGDQAAWAALQATFEPLVRADTVTEALIQDALARLLAGRTAIVVAHRLSTIRNADLNCVVRAGRIAERGTHEALLRQGGIYRELYERQFVDVAEE
jgi:ABC-type multidrug transport system fused ATPase/permease subunit